MRKKMIFFIAAASPLLILLIIQLAIQSNNQLEEAQAAEPAAAAPAFAIGGSDSDVKEIKIINAAGMVQLVHSKRPSGSEGIEWTLRTKPGFPVDQKLVNDLAVSTIHIRLHVLDEHVTNFSAFGIDPANAEVSVTLTDDTEHTIKIGRETPDQANYYAVIKDEPGIYLMNSGQAKKLLAGVNEWFDKQIPEINLEKIKSVEIVKTGKLYMNLIAKQTSEPIPEASLPGAHLLPANHLIMRYPIPDREVYLEDFAKQTFGLPAGTTSLTNKTIKVVSIVDAKPADLGQYGLSTPALELNIQDDQTKVHLLLGDVSGDIIYAKFADESYIFSINRESIRSLFTFQPIQFIDRFLTLIHIVDCDRLIIEAAPSKFDMIIQHRQLPIVNGAFTQKEEQSGTLNGKAIEADTWRKLYEMTIGLQFDAVIEPVDKPGTPSATIKYTTQKGVKTVAFYPYADNFFLAQIGEGPAQYVINEQAVNEVIAAYKDIAS